MKNLNDILKEKNVNELNNYINDNGIKDINITELLINGIIDDDKVELLKVLIDSGADVNLEDKKGLSTLIVASYKDNLEIVKYLVKNGADVNLQNKYGWSALILASVKGHLEIVKVLVENRADVNLQNKDGWTALIEASYKDNLEIVKVLIENGADVNLQTKDGVSALIGASSQGHLEIVKYLVENGADINLQNKYGWSALILASVKGHLEIVKVLIENGADVNLEDKKGLSTLIVASYKDNLEIVKYLVKNGADVNLQNKDGWTALIGASSQGHLEIVKYLVENGADINLQTKDGVSALMYAIIDGEIFLQLIKNSSLSIIDKEKNLRVFAYFGKVNIEIVKYLIENNANINLRNNAGMNAFNIAKFNNDIEIMKLLIDNNCETDELKENIIMHKLFNTISYFKIPELKSKEILKIRRLMGLGFTNGSLKEEFFKDALTLKEDFIKDFIKGGIFKLIKDDLIKFKNFIINYFTKTKEERLKEKYEQLDKYNSESLIALEERNFEKLKNKQLNISALDLIKNDYSLDFVEISDYKDINWQDIHGKTALFYAIEKKDKELIDNLIKKGADLDIKDNNGDTILDICDSETLKYIFDIQKEIQLHNPQSLVKILTNFTIDTPIKWTTHSWKGRYENSFDKFINDTYNQWLRIEDELKELSLDLHQKIYDFIFNKKESEKSWCTNTDIKIGWSSLEGLKQWIDEGKEPFEFKLKDSYFVDNKEIITFGQVIELFKYEIEFRGNLKNIFENLQESFGREVNLDISDNLENVSFYTDTKKINEIISNIITNSIRQRTEYKRFEIDLKKPNIEYYELYITHTNSKSTRDAKELLDRFKNKKGDSDVSSLENLCDYSIEASFKEDSFRLNILKSEAINDIIKLEEKPTGFRYIMRFYK